MSLELYFAYVTATLVVLAIPGPTILLLISYSLSQGKRAALACILGVAIGDASCAAMSLLGLGAILAASATLFTALKWIGAAYLLWLGVKMWRKASQGLSVPQMPTTSPRRIFVHTYVVTALNPKGIIFFMAFLPHFIDPGSPTPPQLLLMGTTFVVLGIVNATAYAMLSTAIGARLRSPRLLRTMNRIGGGFLMSAAALTFSMQRS